MVVQRAFYNKINRDNYYWNNLNTINYKFMNIEYKLLNSYI